MHCGQKNLPRKGEGFLGGFQAGLQSRCLRGILGISLSTGDNGSWTRRDAASPRKGENRPHSHSERQWLQTELKPSDSDLGVHMKPMEDGELRRGKRAEGGTLGKGTEEQKEPFKDSQRTLPKRQGK